MRTKMLIAAVLLSCAGVTAQTTVTTPTDDPVIMTINGQDVKRSEFEYSYNKNNAEGVIDKKSVKDYIPLFVNYKLKVDAAKAAHLDTLSSFKKEFLGYRDQQVRPSFINDADVEAEAQKIYRETQQRVDSMGGLVKVGHILFMARQQDPQEKWDAAQRRCDSVYTVLKKGGDFGQLAKEFSQDPYSAKQGGLLGWIQKGQVVKEFEDAAYSMKPGEVSKPIKTAFGYHIIKVLDKSNFFPYDSVKADIHRFIEQRGLREQIINEKLDSIAKAEGNGTTAEDVVSNRLAKLEETDQNLKYLVQEYHDGLLLYEISNRTVWDKAAKDEAGLEKFFKKNKKNYKWDSPRFKGIAYHVKTQADVQRVKDAVAKEPFNKWADILRKTFNSDSVQIRVEKGIFKLGDNALVDRDIFKKDTTVTPLKKYPIDATYGKVLKKPETMDDVRGLVVADYQEALEKQWMDDLHRKATIKVNDDVVATVNKH